MILLNTGNYIKDLLTQEYEISDKGIGLEEKFILSRANSTLKKVEELFEEYRLDETIGEIEKLFLDLSRIYIKITRDKANNDETRKIVIDITLRVYIKILKMFSCTCPLISEKLWQDLRKLKVVSEESVHLSSWPKYDKSLIDTKLEKEFQLALEIIEKGLSERDKEQIGLKWPLSRAIINSEEKLNKNLSEIIKNQLNVKELGFKNSKDIAVKLDTKLTKELEAEGYAREISRKVQAARKNAGFVKTDEINLVLELDSNLENSLEDFKEFIKERVNAKNIILGKDKNNYSNVFEEKIKDKKIKILFNKV